MAISLEVILLFILTIYNLPLIYLEPSPLSTQNLETWFLTSLVTFLLMIYLFLDFKNSPYLLKLITILAIISLTVLTPLLLSLPFSYLNYFILFKLFAYLLLLSLTIYLITRNWENKSQKLTIIILMTLNPLFTFLLVRENNLGVFLWIVVYFIIIKLQKTRLRKNIFSLDANLLVLLCILNLTCQRGVLFDPLPFNVWSELMYTFTVVTVLILLTAYLIIDIFLKKRVKELKNTSGELPFYKIKFLIMVTIILVLVLPRTFIIISIRHHTSPHRFVHDGALQTEEAIKMTLSGKNPYTENYLNTPVKDCLPISKPNPVLYHYIYLPFHILFSVPFYLLSNSLLGWYDQRFVYIFLFLILLPLLPQLTNDYSNKLSLLILLTLNPFFVSFFEDGRNDIFVLFWIILAFCLLKKHKEELATASLGLASVSKQNTWLILPFYLIYIWGKHLKLKSNLKIKILHMFKSIVPLILVGILFLSPFLLWDFVSFIDDVFYYPTGRSEISMPIRGIAGWGFGSIVLSMKWARDASSYFPFWIFQSILGLPLLFYLLKKQIRSNRLNQMFSRYSAVLFVTMYFSQYFHDNYLEFIMWMMMLSCFCNINDN